MNVEEDNNFDNFFEKMQTKENIRNLKIAGAGLTAAAIAAGINKVRRRPTEQLRVSSGDNNNGETSGHMHQGALSPNHADSQNRHAANIITDYTEETFQENFGDLHDLLKVNINELYEIMKEDNITFTKETPELNTIAENIFDEFKNRLTTQRQR